MEAVLFGQLGWMPDDLHRVTFKEMLNAVKGHRQGMKERWEMVRIASFYSVAPYWDSKKGDLTWDKIKLPIDPIEERKLEVGKSKKLSKDELIEVYRKAGFQLKEHEIERLFKTT